LATSVDGVLLLVRQGQAQKDLVAQVAEQIASVGGHLLGVIVNAVQGRGRQYRAYYGEYAPPEGPSPAASPGSKPAR
jgi:Mrp family chromosome partitioning ATPase